MWKGTGKKGKMEWQEPCGKEEEREKREGGKGQEQGGNGGSCTAATLQCKAQAQTARMMQNGTL